MEKFTKIKSIPAYIPLMNIDTDKIIPKQFLKTIKRIRMVKVFFNNSCNICRAEISHYKKHSNENVEWIDVTNNLEAQKITSKSYKQLLRRMHVIQDGKVIDGAESFLIIWKNVPRYNFLYKIFKIKPLFFLLNIFYEIAAFFLFIKNKHLLSDEKN